MTKKKVTYTKEMKQLTAFRKNIMEGVNYYTELFKEKKLPRRLRRRRG